MVNALKATIVSAPPTSPGMRVIATEQDAIEAFGEHSEWRYWVREWLARPPPPPLVLTPPRGRPGPTVGKG